MGNTINIAMLKKSGRDYAGLEALMDAWKVEAICSFEATATT